MLRTIRDKRLLWPGVAALAGLALLISLGNWQMQRLAWKEGLIAAIGARQARRYFLTAEKFGAA